MTGKSSREDRFIWRKDDLSITRAHIFLGDQQKIRAEKILSAAKEEVARDEASHR